MSKRLFAKSHPYLGAIKNMIIRDATMMTLPKAKKLGARNSFLNSTMVDTDCSRGPFN